MKKKIFTLLVLLAAVVTGAWAETITWDDTNVFKRENQGVFITQDNMQGSAVTSTSASATYEGITISCDKSDGSHLMLCASSGPAAGKLTLRGASGDSFTFTAPTGKIFTKIEINGRVSTFTPYGDWTKPSDMQIAWSGTAANTVTLGSVNTSMPQVRSIVFYVEEPLPGYTVTLAEGTEDAASWQGKAGTGDYQSLPLTGVEAGTAVSFKYFGTKKVESVKAVKKASATPLDNTTTAWSAGIFAVPAGGLTYSDAITVSGDVTLVLTDGETLTLNKGISIAEGATLTVEGNGTMAVNGTNNSTASTVAGTGMLVLTSGTLTAKGGNGQSIDGQDRVTGNTGGAAINGSVTVNGGSLTATGGNGGSVTGNSKKSTGGAGGTAITGALNINGGTVVTTNGSDGTSESPFATAPNTAGSGGKAVAGTVTDNR